MRKIGEWQEPKRVQGTLGAYAHYQLDAETIDDDDNFRYGSAVVVADRTDEHADQNVNWEVTVDGWFTKRGHARDIRAAKADAARALRVALGIEDDSRRRRQG